MRTNIATNIVVYVLVLSVLPVMSTALATEPPNPRERCRNLLVEENGDSMMQNYNAAFFGLYENVFRQYSTLHDKRAALEFMGTLFSSGLANAYSAMGFERGSPREFVRVVGERDKSVGLKVDFPEVTEGRIVYRFHTDPFPNLKGLVDHAELDRTYMSFKVSHLLGEGWSYTTTKHLWNGDPYTEHVIEKRTK